jgi:hypothetical protein
MLNNKDTIISEKNGAVPKLKMARMPSSKASHFFLPKRNNFFIQIRWVLVAPPRVR